MYRTNNAFVVDRKVVYPAELNAKYVTLRVELYLYSYMTKALVTAVCNRLMGVSRLGELAWGSGMNGYVRSDRQRY